MQTASDKRQTVLGERDFSLEDQLVFARFSGDWNPIHINPLYARRCLTGQAVVHGIHMLLWALECWAAQSGKDAGLTRLKVQFIRPAFLDERLVCRSTEKSASEVVLEVAGSAGQAVMIEFTVGSGSAVRPGIRAAAAVSAPTPALALGLEDLAARTGAWEIEAEEGLAERLFPASVGLWGDMLPVMLAHTSRLVGMECPGLHSLFSELELSASDAGVSTPLGLFDYQVTHVERRFGLVSIKVAGAGFAGTVRAFLRPPPARQADMASIKRVVAGNAFSNQRALVVGGGAVTAPGHAGTGAAQTGPSQGADAVTG